MATRLRTKERETFGGIDPGKEGWMVLWDGRRVVMAHPIPYLDKLVDEVAVLDILREWKRRGCQHVNLEYQQSFPGQGVAGTHNAGINYGILRCALVAVGLRRSFPKPTEWKKDAGISAAKVKLPKLPEKPKKNARRAVKEQYARIKKQRGVISRAHKTRLKELACRRAQDLAPGYDFRISERADKPHDGKCEAFLLAWLAHQQHKTGG